mgnify:CR=1 FL=1
MLNPVVKFSSGLTAPLRALKFLARNPRLWPFALMPALICAVILGALLYGGWTHSLSLYELVVPDFLKASKTGAETSWLTKLGLDILQEISLVVLRVTVALTAAIMAILLGKILAAPFNDALSERAEQIYNTQAPSKEPFSIKVILQDSWWAVRWEAKKVIIYLMVLLPLLLLNLIPFVGSFLYAGLAFVFNVSFLAYDYMDFPLERRRGPNGRHGARERGSILWRHRWPMLGYGMSTSLLLFLPLINFLFLPLAVTGATLLYVDLEAQERGLVEA